MRTPVTTVCMLILLGACASPVVSETPPTFTTCAAAVSYYKGLVGGPLRAPVSYKSYRVIKPHSAVTMDFSPMRLNVYTDDKGIITDARCG